MRIFKHAMESLGSYNRDRSNSGQRVQQGGNQSFEIDKKYSTPDFLFETVKKPLNPVPQQQQQKKISLSKNFFASLSSMEAKISDEKYRSVEMVDMVINMYKQCVEVYDTVQDPIKYYFLDKIQNASALSQTCKNKKNEIKKLPDRKQIDEEVDVFVDAVENLSNLNPDDIVISKNQLLQKNFDRQVIESQSEKQITLNVQCEEGIETQKQKSEQFEGEVSMKSLSKIRSKRVSLSKQVEIQSESNNDIKNSLVQTHHSSAQQTDKLILDSLVVQENSLQDRLKRRGKKTMIHSSTSGLLEAPNKDLQMFLQQYNGVQQQQNQI